MVFPFFHVALLVTDFVLHSFHSTVSGNPNAARNWTWPRRQSYNYNYSMFPAKNRNQHLGFKSNLVREADQIMMANTATSLPTRDTTHSECLWKGLPLTPIDMHHHSQSMGGVRRTSHMRANMSKRAIYLLLPPSCRIKELGSWSEEEAERSLVRRIENKGATRCGW